MKQKLKNKLIKYLFNTVTVDDVLVNKRGDIFIDGKKLSDKEMSNLRVEAQYLKESRLYAIMSSLVVNKAKRTMFERSMTFDDMVSGKMLLLADDLQKKIVDRLARDK